MFEEILLYSLMILSFLGSVVSIYTAIRVRKICQLVESDYEPPLPSFPLDHLSVIVDYDLDYEEPSWLGDCDEFLEGNR